MSTSGLILDNPSDEAIRSIRALLRGFGFSEPSHLDRLATRIARSIELSPGTSFREQLEVRVVCWLGPHFDPMPRELFFASARSAYLRSGAAERWPEAFLCETPEGLVTALRQALPSPTPVEAPCAMPEQSLAPATWIVRLGQLWSPQAQGSWNS